MKFIAIDFLNTNFKELFTIVIIILSSISICHSQENSSISNNCIYTEVGMRWAGTPLSLNYERHFDTKRSVKIFGKIGAAFGGTAFGSSGFGGLTAIGIQIGEGKHHFIADIGVFLGSDQYHGLFALPLLDVGYRYLKQKGGFTFHGKIGAIGLSIGFGYAF